MMTLATAKRLVKKLREGDVMLVSEHGLIHSIKRLLERSRWNHVMLYIGQGRTIEATPKKGAHVCDLLYDLTEKPYIAYQVFRNKRLKPKERKKIVNTALRQFKGKKFSWLHYVKIVFGRTLHWRKEGNKSLICKPGHKCGTGGVVCSNMVSMAYYAAGFPISERYMPEYIVPKDYEHSQTLWKVLEGRVKTK